MEGSKDQIDEVEEHSGHAKSDMGRGYYKGPVFQLSNRQKR